MSFSECVCACVCVHVCECAVPLTKECGPGLPQVLNLIQQVLQKLGNAVIMCY